MRYDTKVYFWKDETGKYNPVTHKHDNNLKLVFTAYANVTDLGLAKQVELLGSIKEGSKTIRMIDLPPDKYDFIKIENDSHKYRFVNSLNVSKGYAMIVGRDNG
ncbi:hypothetical protein [Lactobacillus amylovorus]|uniref:hypothetical protein n=1 Tax=Lactobacillus amylovorus TaxID=1604 RepID=UPI00232E3B6A|nr:hypothetical protein [Lactobacillus amylovorus]MDB6233515.1 hypothetical protein [Lactobacillus amylovorus]MDB6259667.1 hypothetical protein [Lactobacillus amylovorus]